MLTTSKIVDIIEEYRYHKLHGLSKSQASLSGGTAIFAQDLN